MHSFFSSCITLTDQKENKQIQYYSEQTRGMTVQKETKRVFFFSVLHFVEKCVRVCLGW